MIARASKDAVHFNQITGVVFLGECRVIDRRIGETSGCLMREHEKVALLVSPFGPRLRLFVVQFESEVRPFRVFTSTRSTQESGSITLSSTRRQRSPGKVAALFINS